MTTNKLTMAQALLKFLSQQFISLDGEEYHFVHGMFAIFGHGNVTGIGEALEYDNYGIKLFQGHNEQGMAHAATAFAKQKNRLGIIACTSSIGPGATNMVTAAATATVNRIPLLLLPGDVFSSRQPDPVLQQIERTHNYNITANDCFKPVSKYWDRINRPEQLMTACLNAFRVLTDPVETGAVTLCLPQDVQAESYNYPDEFFKKRIWYIDRMPPSNRSIEAATNLIKKSHKPLVIVGGGIHYSLATEILKKFTDKHKIPVCETQAGKSSLNWDNPFNVGAIGVTGGLAANILAQQADVILIVGSRLQDFTTASKTAFDHKHAKIIHININDFDGLKMDALLVKGDAKCGLESLSVALNDYVTSRDYQTIISELRQQWMKEVDRLYQISDEDGLGQTQIVGTLNAFLQPEDVIICAAGSLPGDLHRLWRSKRPKDYHVEYAYSCMGYEVAAGLGVRMAKHDGEIYVIVGDGSFIMLHSELLTAIQENHKVNIILLDNSGFQCIKNLQESCGSDGFGTELRSRNQQTQHLDGPKLPINFSKYAEALGATVYKANSITEFLSSLEDAKKQNNSTLIELKVLANSMSDSYESWWRVGIAEVSQSDQVTSSYHEAQKMITKVRDY